MTKISSLPALAAVDADTSADLVTVVDVSETGAARNKKQTLAVFADTIVGEFGALATRDDINGGDWSGTDLALVDGGTGASTAAGARTNLGVYSTTDVDTAIAAASGTYNDEKAQDAVGAILTDSSTIDFTYTDATPEITASVKSGSIGPTELAATAVTPGSYTAANITVDADGRITAAASGSGGASALDDLTDVDAPAPSDGDLLAYDSGSGDWVPIAPASVSGIIQYWFDPPSASDFTLFSGDATAATLTDDADIGLVVTTGSASNFGITRGGYKALPVGDFSVAMRAQFSSSSSAYQAGGLALYESATGKAHLFMLFQAPSDTEIRRTTIAGTYTSDVKFTAKPTNWDAWLHISRVGSNLIFGLSADGKHPYSIQTIAQTTYLTTAPNRIGPAIWLLNATDIPVLTVPAWHQSW